MVTVVVDAVVSVVVGAVVTVVVDAVVSVVVDAVVTVVLGAVVCVVVDAVVSVVVDAVVTVVVDAVVTVVVGAVVTVVLGAVVTVVVGTVLRVVGGIVIVVVEIVVVVGRLVVEGADVVVVGGRVVEVEVVVDVLVVDVVAGWVVEVVVVETGRSWTNTSYVPLVSPATRLVAVPWNATKPPSAERAAPELGPFPWVPSEATLTRSVVPVCRSCTNTSVLPFVSPATRLVAVLWNATKRPSAERAGPALKPFPSVPPEATLTRSVVPVCRSWTNTSVAPFVSPATRLVASLWNATKRPSAESAGKAKKPPLLPLPCVPPPDATLTRSLVPVCRSWTNTSVVPFVSPATRLVASLSNATKRPSAERAGSQLASLAWVPPEATLTRTVVSAPAARPN